MKPLAEAFAHDVPCSMCEGGIVPITFRWLVGTKGCLCARCVEKHAPPPPRPPEDDMTRPRGLEKALHRAGLLDQPEIVESLGITTRDPEPGIKPGATWAQAATAVAEFRRDESRRVLVLSGDSGCGKSTCAAWAAWPDGRYVPRERWTRLKGFAGTANEVWARDEIDRLLTVRGIVVLDEVCAVVGSRNGRGGLRSLDTAPEMGVVDAIVKGRHARQRRTIMTTNANDTEFLDLYGTLARAVWSRSVPCAPIRGGA